MFFAICFLVALRAVAITWSIGRFLRPALRVPSRELLGAVWWWALPVTDRFPAVLSRSKSCQSFVHFFVEAVHVLVVVGDFHKAVEAVSGAFLTHDSVMR